MKNQKRSLKLNDLNQEKLDNKESAAIQGGFSVCFCYCLFTTNDSLRTSGHMKLYETDVFVM